MYFHSQMLVVIALCHYLEQSLSGCKGWVSLETVSYPISYSVLTGI